MSLGRWWVRVPLSLLLDVSWGLSSGDAALRSECPAAWVVGCCHGLHHHTPVSLSPLISRRRAAPRKAGQRWGPSSWLAQWDRYGRWQAGVQNPPTSSLCGPYPLQRQKGSGGLCLGTAPGGDESKEVCNTCLVPASVILMGGGSSKDEQL